MKTLHLISAKIILFFSLILFSASQLPAFSQDLPDVYLRGSMNGWNIEKKYKFTREGNNYSLVITENNPLYGEFKIADEKWEEVNLGGYISDLTVDNSTYLHLMYAGENLLTSRNIDNAVISFTFTEAFSNEVVKFVIDGIEPDPDQNPTPEPEPIPTPDPDTNPDAHISGTLPVLYINVYTDEKHTKYDNEIISYNLSHKDYFTQAEYWLDLNDCKWIKDAGAKSTGSKDEPLPLQIKARGNWTRIGFSKKPFKLKLDKKQDLLGLTPEKSKHYALLAHADDSYGYMRNFTAFNLGERIGLPWTPGMQPVEVVINGDYRGLYFLTESVRVGDGRIPIEELKDNETSQNLISGGYVVELDNYYEDNQIQLEELHCADGYHWYDELRITWDTPEEYSDIQKRFITDQFSEMNSAIGRNSNDIWKYMDLDDAARYYLVREITGDVEAYHGSTYLYRDRGEGQKWHFSPLWDAGNSFNGYYDAFFYDCDPFGNTWIPSMRENKMFNEKVVKTWLWFMQNNYSGIEEDLEEFASHVVGATGSDFVRWEHAEIPSGGQRVVDNRNMSEKLENVKWYLRLKTEWLKNQFGDYTAGKFSEPDRDTTPAAPLPSYAQIVPGDQDDNNNPGNGDENLPGDGDENLPGDGDDNNNPGNGDDNNNPGNGGNNNNPGNGDDNDSGNDDNNTPGMNGVEYIDADNTLTLEFYTLQGVKVQNPQKGQMYIVRYGSKTTKIVF